MNKKFEFTGDCTAEKLVERAVKNARPMRGTAFRWAVVKMVFGCGSTTATRLCKHFGLDPDEGVKA